MEAIKFTGAREISTLEEFALKDGWKNAAKESFIPLAMKGVDKWTRWFALQVMAVQKDVDYAWSQYGLFQYVPAPYHYMICCVVICVPFALVCTLLCCIVDEDESQESRPAPKKNNVKPEKLD